MPRIKTLERMVELLQAFTPSQPSWKLHELHTHCGWDKATTYRFVNALVQVEILQRDEDDAYSLGIFPLKLAAVYMSTRPERHELVSHIEMLARDTGLTSQVCVFHRDIVTVILSSESSRPLRAAAMLGERVPLHATASGKAVLAQLDDDEIRRLLPERLPSFTSRTIVDREKLIAEIRQIRIEEVARAESELAEGLTAVAVPIPEGVFSSAPAAVGCAGPSVDLAAREWHNAERKLKEVQEIVRSRALNPAVARRQT